MAATTTTDALADIENNAPPGTIIPPATAKNHIEKAAGYVARNGIAFEERMKAGPDKTKLNFIFEDDPYNAYYKWRVSEIKAGRGNDISAGREKESGATGVSGQGREERRGPEKPEEFLFSARMPNINAQDLEIVKLTAVFVAKNGRSWMTTLSQREAGNFQFDFLRPQHSLYQFFSRLVDQYTFLIQGPDVDDGRPQKKRMVELEENVADKYRVLERAKKRAEYVRWEQAQKVAKEESEEQEKIAFQQIDWHDFVVVETVVFDERDAEAQLPPPTTKNDLQSASLEQKAAMSINPNRRIEEGFPSFDDQASFYGNEQQQQAQAPAVQSYAPTPTPPVPQSAWHPPPSENDSAGRLAELRINQDRARAAQEAARLAPSAQKIRTDYIPRAQQLKTNQQPANTSLCPNCGQAILNTEIEQHMRIEMLDPQWRDQNKINQQRSSTTNLSTEDVSRNLRRLASQRGDVFDARATVSGGVDEQEAKRQKLLAESEEQQQPPANVDEQIRNLHQRYRG
ncbi:hypothetical protein LTR62_006907 [Meristemomyces frigidus]|uniref:SURP motif domain-containing protein n=1 Tax=Meristemomyces frigidus TaxID=1508187 RepID=A0AAN7YE71_9PEZI|nr:hypothetical protein LTR62_006907 [Meristemomyces frigidus]